MLGLIKSKNFNHPQIFDEQSLETYAESHIIKTLKLESVSTMIHIVQFVFIVEQDAPHWKTSRTEYGCWWVNFQGSGTSRWPKVRSPSSPDTNPVDSSFWFFFSKSNARSLPLTPIWSIRIVSFRRNGQKRQFFLPYFSAQICEQTRDCYIYYRLLFEKLTTYFTK